MTAKYLISDFQKALLYRIETCDQTAADFFVVAPLVIDCRDDAAGYNAAVTASQRDTILKRYEAGKLRFVSGLLRPAHAYARQKLVERFRLLDRDAVAQVQAFLSDWSGQRGRRPDQRGRPGEDRLASGVDLLLPGGLRLGFDLSDFIGL